MESSKPADPLPSELKLQPTDLSTPLISKLYKAYFDDPALSDLTIRLSNRAVRTHRIVLCRGSEYFSKLLTGRFQEADAQEIELHEDDPHAMMALLRFLYGLPYTTDDTQRWTDSLQPHALVYVVADKYQVRALQQEICASMRKIVTSKAYLEFVLNMKAPFMSHSKNTADFVGALRTIWVGTMANDTHARKVMMNFLLGNIDYFRQDGGFLSLLKEHPDLGTEILGHSDLDCEAQSYWSCQRKLCVDHVPTCQKCRYGAQPQVVRRHRFDEVWPCSSCEAVDHPVCSDCATRIYWTRLPVSEF